MNMHVRYMMIITNCIMKAVITMRYAKNLRMRKRQMIIRKRLKEGGQKTIIWL